jgi:D-glycero-D-manno-heptose 1,7-bisphosphate phosphatase
MIIMLSGSWLPSHLLTMRWYEMPKRSFLKCPTSSPMILPEKVLWGMLRSRETDGLRSAIFFDRDGTVNLEGGYLLDPAGVELYSDVGAAIHNFSRLGYLIVIISNQSAIGRHLMTTSQFEKVNDSIWSLLRRADSNYDALYYCPHSPNSKPPCECRKPKPGLILQAAWDLGIDLDTSFFVGDKVSDIQAGQAAGCRTILVLTGKGIESLNLLEHVGIKPDSVQNTLIEAFEYISSPGRC